MKRITICTALAGLAFATPAAAQSVSIADPAKFAATLKGMGMAPGPVTDTGKGPELAVAIDEMPTTIKFVGCTNGKACRYITLVSGFTDVVKPPVAWMQKINDDFDLIKVGVNDRDHLYLFAAHVVEGMPVAQLQKIFDYWSADTSAVGNEAQKAGVAAKK